MSDSKIERNEGEWRAFLADGDAEVITDPEEIAAMLLDEDLMGGTISIRRGSALPGEDGCLPGTWTSNDLFLEVELGEVLPEDGIATWELVQKAAWGMNQTAIPAPDTGPTEYLIWSQHHKMWWAPEGCGYRRDIVDAGRYALDDAQRLIGRGCGCCAVPEVVIPVPGPEVFAQPGKVGEWVTKQIEQATVARFEANDINKHALRARAAEDVAQPDDIEMEPAQ